jgi:multicomponent Na+:H+ antiporter subunit F
MIAAQSFLDLCIVVSLVVLCISLALGIYRVIVGPTLPDRVLALDMLVAVSIGLIAVLGVRTGFSFHVDIAISLGLVGFLATVAFARFVLHRGTAGRDADRADGQEPAAGARR